MTIVNATPHDIHFHQECGNIHTFPKSGIVGRVNSSTTPAEAVAGFKASRATYGNVLGLPDPQEGIVYIVSGLVFQESNRADLIAPLTDSSAIRNEAGQIAGITSFSVR